MDDIEIVELYHSRNENAIAVTQGKYGRMLHGMAWNILKNREDSEEIVSDTYQKAWDTMPPQWPQSLMAYLGRMTRNGAINRWRQIHAQKRYGGGDVLLSELEGCLPSGTDVEQTIELGELTCILESWLDSLPQDDRVLFLRRYWYCERLQDLAKATGTSPNKLAGRMFRLRAGLKMRLEGEGVAL